MTALDDDDRLRLDYQQTTDLLRVLTDVRFKLLAFVPTISGAAVGLLGHPVGCANPSGGYESRPWPCVGRRVDLFGIG